MGSRFGIPPQPVTILLRLEGAAVGISAIIAFALTGANWWLFLLVMVPDLSFFRLALGQRRGSMVYDLAHTYTWPLILIVAGLLTPAGLLLPLGLIWAVHIGVDRTLGYGLKYPDSIETTHLGLIGRARKAAHDANAG